MEKRRELKFQNLIELVLYRQTGINYNKEKLFITKHTWSTHFGHLQSFKRDWDGQCSHTKHYKSFVACNATWISPYIPLMLS